jgi:DNA-binding transcriptional LysR family regulator
VELSRLEAFLAVARRGSMRAAAEALHLGQPALSARIALLEMELGARVFERSKRGMSLTRAGHALVPHAERALEAAEAGREAVRHVEQGDEGELVIAAASAINAFVVPELVARFRRFHPGVHLFVRTGSAEDIVELVALGTAQVGLVREISDPRVVQAAVYDEEVLLAARSDHPFVSEGAIPVTRLADATLILYDRRSADFEITQALLRGSGVAPYGVIEVDSVDTARRLVARGLGVALLPSTAVAADIAAGELARVELTGAAVPRRRVVAIERPAGSRWAPVTTIRELLAEVPSFVPGALAPG